MTKSRWTGENARILELLKVPWKLGAAKAIRVTDDGDAYINDEFVGRIPSADLILRVQQIMLRRFPRLDDADEHDWVKAGGNEID